MTLKRVLYIAGFAVLFVSLLPVLSVLLAGSVASLAGCDLNEGGINPCTILGIDWGETLYTMAMMGWFALATLPFAALAAVFILLLVLFDLIRYLRG